MEDMDKDFFDKEFEKMNAREEQNKPEPSMYDLYNGSNGSEPPAPAKSKKTLSIVLISLALVMCILFGWFLCVLFNGNGSTNVPTEEVDAYKQQVFSALKQEMSDLFVQAEWAEAESYVQQQIASGVVKEEDKLLGKFEYVRSKYYGDVDKKTWNDSVEAAIQRVNSGEIFEKDALSVVVSSADSEHISTIFETAWKNAVEQSDGKLDSGELEQIAILSSTLNFLRDNYYKDIPQSAWTEAVAAAGTALLQSAGDKYCSLMTPQELYEYYNPASTTIGSGSSELFGISYSLLDTVGLYVSSVVTDSSCYGVMQSGDIVLKVSNMKDSDGNDVAINGQKVTDFCFNEVSSVDEASIVMNSVHSATFSVLRAGEILTPHITRSAIDFANDKYKFEYVEFYFGKDCASVSVNKTANKASTTYDIRELRNLPSDAGYIRISQFMYSGSSDVLTEFKEAMKLFKERGLKKLVLDLKGNPGGRVDYVCEIASMLVADFNLSDVEKSQVTSGGKLLITSLVPRKGATEYYYYPSTYKNYFGEKPTDGKCSIVVWTDENSASASELLTGALTDYGTGVQMGTKTYGKGIAQTITTLPYSDSVITHYGTTQTYNWAVYYTFAQYNSPLGNNIHGVGYEPSAKFNNLKTYSDLWKATNEYWK